MADNIHINWRKLLTRILLYFAVAFIPAYFI